MSRGLRGDSNHPKSSSGTPHFFKIILQETLEENKLQIPKNFVRKCGETLSTSVCVKLSCGSKWKIKLKEYDGKLWLEKGWPEFAKHYNIGRGHMLIFRYDGNSEFHAVIFDTSTVEIDYPSNPVHSDESSIDGKLRVPKREVIDDDIVEILDDFEPCHKTGVKSSLPCFPSPKRMKTSPTGNIQSNLSRPKAKGSHHCETIVENSKNKGNSKNSRPGMKGKLDLPAKSTTRQRKVGILRPMKTLDRSERIAALQKTNCFKSERPFFKVVIQPYYFLGKFLAIPSNFAKIHLQNQSDDVILKVPNGNKTWHVNYSFGVQKNARLRAGWKAFARNNNLKVGDVCVFVLLKEVKISFEVVIFRVKGSSKAILSPAHDKTGAPSFHKNFPAKQENGCKSTPWKTSQNREPQVVRKQIQLTSHDKVKILEKAPFESEKPFFRAIIQPSYKWHVHVPLDLAERHIKKEGDVVLSIPNGRSWSAQFRIRSQKTVKTAAVICDGWKKFMADNDLKVGDICIFELLDGTKISFQVSIVRVADEKKHPGSQAGDLARCTDKPKGDEMVKIETD